jgi:hypothetical protein
MAVKGKLRNQKETDHSNNNPASARKGRTMNALTQFKKMPILALLIALAFAAVASPAAAQEQHPDQVLEWNQIFIDTLIATSTPNSSSQRLGAIVHTAIFDAYNGIERRYTPVFVPQSAPSGASRRAAVIAAAYTALVALFPSQAQVLTDRYVASLAALSDDGEDGGQSRERGIAWGTQVAEAVLAWRATDGFNVSYPSFFGGTAVGQWRPTPPAFGPMSAQGLAFTAMFVLDNNTQFRPGSPRTLTAPPTRTISTLSRRSVAIPDRRALKIKQRSLDSGKATPAPIGIRQRTR